MHHPPRLTAATTAAQCRPRVIHLFGLQRLASDEMLAQILDRGDLHDWRVLYQLARADAALRARIKRIVLTVPLPLPHFWLAALASLGDPVDLGARVPNYYNESSL